MLILLVALETKVNALAGPATGPHMRTGRHLALAWGYPEQMDMMR